MRLLKAASHLIDWSGRSVSWLTLLMVLVTFFVVILRYVFDIGSIALQDSITYLHAMVFLVSASWVLKQDAHVRVDVFYTRFSEKTKNWVDLFGSLLLLLPVMCFITYISWDYVAASWSVSEGSREAGGLGGVYLLKSLILIFTALLLIQGFIQIFDAIRNIRSHSEDHTDDSGNIL